MTPLPPAIVLLTPAGADTARRLKAALPDADLHGGPRVAEADRRFDDAPAHIRALFTAGRPVIGVCAAGILIRAVAPALADKQAEPPVLAVSADGATVVPLLGGHRGANALARRLAEALDATPAITTAGEAAFGLGLDAPPEGWHVANPEAAKPIMAELLAGRPVALETELETDGEGEGHWPDPALFAAQSESVVRVTPMGIMPDAGELLIHPPVLAVGLGCERDTPPDDVMELVTETLAAAGLAEASVAVVASLDLKSDEAAMHACAAMLNAPARFFDAATLEAEAPRLETPSDVVFAEVGCHGVAEGAALAAAGPEATLILPKVKGARATCAVAQSPHPIDGASVGRPRGRLTVVGIGPGAEAWRSPAVSRAVTRATDLVGYGLYLDLLGPLAEGKRHHMSELGEETERARRSLQLAAEGREVCLVCSGDAGIYALATLVFELLEFEATESWSRIKVSVEPGISALQAAAARAGAPLGHDFCAISLSDLLTPVEAIEKRLTAAAEGDFVVAFYNPVSKRRKELLPRARDILLTGRPPETPVILARNLGRADETIRVVPLGELTADHADMLTLVMVGSSETRVTPGGFVYTPRGYARKRG